MHEDDYPDCGNIKLGGRHSDTVAAIVAGVIAAAVAGLLLLRFCS